MEPHQINQLRQEIGWSLAEFGRYFGVTAQAVLKWERGTAQPNDFALATMIQLQHKLREAQEEKQKLQFINGLKRALLTGGVLAILAYLFNEKD